MTDRDVDPVGATPLDPDETMGLKHRHVSTRAELDGLEQANIEQALLWLPRRRRFDILTKAALRRLHELMFGEVWAWAGVYRRTEKSIGIDPSQIPTALRTLLDDANYWAANNTFAPLEAAARFHHRLVQIHLFANGNGRHARIATDLYLEEYFSHPPIHWAGGHDFAADRARRTEYLHALRAADRYDVTRLLQFVSADSADKPEL